MYTDPDAIVIRLTEGDLNRVLRDAFLANGGPLFEGRKQRVSRSVSDLSYRARLTEPTLALDAGGLARLHFEIQAVDLRIGAIERRFAGRLARCEDARVRLHDGRRVGIDLDLRFVVDDGGLRIVPESADSPRAATAFRLIKPSRCRNVLLPKWLLWWIGKPHLRRQIGRLDETVLAQARRGAARIDAEGGLLHGEWTVASGEVQLTARAVETSHGALLVGLSAATGAAAPSASPPGPPAPLPALGAGSHIAVSESLVNELLELAFAEYAERRTRPSGDFAKLFRSDALLTLIPGLRELPSTDGLWLVFRFSTPPRVRFRSLSGSEAAHRGSASGDQDRAVIRLELADIEMEVRNADAGEPLGTLRVEAATVELVPYRNPMGGISFDSRANEWRLSTRGLQFDEPLLAATLQELVFAELFETRYEPLGRDGVVLGRSRFLPRSVRHLDGYLVITFGDEPPSHVAGSSAH